MRTMQGVPRQVSKHSGRRNRESGWVDIGHAAVFDDRIDSWNQIRAPDVAAVATAGRVDDGCGDRYSAHEDWVRDDRPVAVVTKSNIRTSDEDVDRNDGPRVHNSA